ncbi:MAG: hypothetical protein KatS3mg101_1141 [Patescibacteria group bacterium]|nr:MAG: hypothetical protein KatS3mg101_1141 [Patescibacteria group bacterium]
MRRGYSHIRKNQAKSKFAPFRWRCFAKKIIKLYSYNEIGSTLFMEAINARARIKDDRQEYDTTDLGLIFIDQYIQNLDEQIAKKLRLVGGAIDENEQTIRLALRNTLDIFYDKSAEEIYDIPTEEILEEISAEHEAAKEAAWLDIEERVEEEFEPERFNWLLYSRDHFRALQRNARMILNKQKREKRLPREANIGIENALYIASIPDLITMPDYQFIIALSDILGREVNWRELNLRSALGFYGKNRIPKGVVNQAIEKALIATFDRLEKIFEDLLKELWKEEPVDERYWEEQELEEYRREHWDYLKSEGWIDDDE